MIVCLALVLKATSAEYGFIGEILYTSAAKPYLKIYAITNIAWDEETRALYDEYAEKGMEFHNMDTLFGKAIMTKSVLIANDPYNDPRAGGLPEGHPHMSAFIGIPFLVGDEIIGLCGIANKPGGFSESLVSELQPILIACTSLIAHYRSRAAQKYQQIAVQNSQELLETTERMAKISTWKWHVERQNVTVSKELLQIWALQKTSVKIRRNFFSNMCMRMIKIMSIVQ